MNSEYLLRSDEEVRWMANSSSTFSWNDVVLYVLMGNDFRLKMQSFWLNILYDPRKALISANQTLNYVLLGNTCNTSLPSNMTSCNFTNIHEIQRRFPSLNLTIITIPSAMEGKAFLPCKAAYGMAEVYRLFPDKKLYFAMDDDTVVSPRRLNQLFRETYLSYRSEAYPLYIGTAHDTCHGHRQVDMLTSMVIKVNITTKANITNHNITNVCYAQGKWNENENSFTSVIVCASS
jgi:hypothetical protein